MAKRFAATIRQEHQQTFLAYNEIPRWPPCPTHELFRLDLQRKRVSTSGEGAADTEDSDQEREFLPYSHVFSRIRIGEKPVRILVEGGAGIGKTALCMLLFKGWENGDFFKKFELLLLLPLHQVKIAKARSLPELICVLFPSHSHEITSYIIQTRGKKVLIIADGLNKLTETFQKGSFLHNLLLGGLLSQASVLITSRPSTSAPLHKLSCVDDFLEVYGFDCSTIHQYIRAKFDSDQQKAISLLEQLESNPIIEQICRIPLNCAVVCFLWQNNTDVFSTTTGLFTEVILNFVYCNMLNTDEYSSHPRLLNIHGLPESLRNPWSSVCEIAFQTIRFNLGTNPQVNLEAIRLSQSGFEILGMLEFVELDKISFLFVHPTFKEYFAALYLIMQPLDRQMVIFKLHSKSKHPTLFFRFYFGLCFQISGSVHVDMAGIAQIMRLLSESYTASNDEYLLCHYAYEAKHSFVTEGIISALSDRTKSFVSMSFGHPSTAQDCVTVMYIIANIQERTFVEIDFHDCHLGDKRICELATVLSNKAKIVQVKILNLNNNNLTDVSVVNLFTQASAAFQYLVKLSLRDNRIGEASICAIKATLSKSSRSMNLLDLSNNRLLTDGIKELQIAIECYSLKNLEVLFLRGTLPANNTSNNIACLYAFATAISSHCPRLRRLDLSAIDLGEPGDPAICNLVSHFTGTKTNLDLRLNREYMPEVEKKFIAVMEDSIRNKGTIDHTVVHGIIVGPGRSGKDSLMNRLLGKEPHDKSYLSASTGVLESVVKVEVKKLYCTTVAAAANSLIWRRLDYNEEALELMMTTARCCSVIHNKRSRKLSQSKMVDSNTISAHDEITEHDKPDRSISSDSLRVKPKTHYYDDYLCDDDFERNIVRDQANQVLIVPVQEKWPDVKDILKSAVESQRMDELREHLESSWSLYLTNTGGQMEFQELLPLLVCGPSVFFITFPLNKELMEHYTVQYHHSDADHTEETYTSPSTLMDEILQTLATIDALDLSGHQQDFQLKPKVFLIGTHKDKLPNHLIDKKIQEIDKQIQEMIRQTSLFDQGSIIFAEGAKQLIFTVNNLSKEDTDFQKIRCALQQTVEKADQFTIACPSTWLIFSLVLRAKHKSSQVLTLDECFTIAQGCGISDRTELSGALHFIHTRLGLVRYFNVKELSKCVVVDPQILFDKITDLIVKTFISDNAEVNEIEDFQGRGIFSIKTMERICKKRPHSDSQLPFKWLLKLLRYLRIAAVFKDKKDNLKCFFPAVLCHAPAWRPTSLKNPDLAQHPALLVAFESGFCPRGVPGALVTYLMTDEMQSVFPWELIPDKVFKNQVSFSIEGCGDIILRIYPTHLQLNLDPEAEISDEDDIQMTCRVVYKCIEQGMNAITKGYKRCDYFFAYYCTLCKCKKRLHPAKIIWRDDRPIKLKCKTMNRQYSLPSDYNVWNLQKLTDQQVSRDLDPTNCGVSRHLGLIADTMHEWEGPIAETLGLTPADVASIKTKHPTELKLQTRLALQMWKQCQGCKATCSALITAFESVGYQEYADSVRRFAAADNIETCTNDFDDDGYCQSPLTMEPFSPKTCVQSLFLTDIPDDNPEDLVHITEKGASELKKIHQEIDIPLSLEAGVNTASIVMKHSLKEESSFKENTITDEVDDLFSGAVASTGPLAAPGTSSRAGNPSSSNPKPLMQSEMAQGQYYSNSSNISELGDFNLNNSPITDHFAQDMTSLVSASSPTTLVGDELPIAMSLLEPAIATVVNETSSSSMSYQQKDLQQQPTISNPGISVSNQRVQHPQFTTPGTQTQEQTNFDAAGKSGIKKSVATPYQPMEQPDQAQLARIISQQQQQQEQDQVVQETSQWMSPQQQQPQTVQNVQQQQQARPVVIWSGIMEVTKEDHPPDIQDHMKEVECHVLTDESDVIRKLQPKQWPQRMTMSTITVTKGIFDSVAKKMNFQFGATIVKTVTFQFLENPQDIPRLRHLMTINYITSVQLVGVQHLSQCPIKILFLVWSDHQKQFTGLVPLVQEQEKIVNFLKQLKIYYDAKIAQIKQFIHAIAIATPQRQEQLMQQVPPTKRAQVLTIVEQVRQQIQQQQQQQQQQQLQGEQMGGVSQQMSEASQQMLQQPQTVQPVQQQQQPQSQQQARPIVVWSGIMDFMEVQDNKHQMRQVQCNILTAKSDDVRELQSNQWPQRMSMNTYPKVLLDSIAQMMNFKSGVNAKWVAFQFLESPHNVTMLRMLMTSEVKTFAIVQLVGVQQLSQCPIKALILFWTDRRKKFAGLIPLEQEKFINVLKQVLSNAQRQRTMLLQQQQQQQQAQQAQQGQQTGMQQRMPYQQQQPSQAGVSSGQALQTHQQQQQQQQPQGMGMPGQQGGAGGVGGGPGGVGGGMTQQQQEQQAQAINRPNPAQGMGGMTQQQQLQQIQQQQRQQQQQTQQQQLAGQGMRGGAGAQQVGQMNRQPMMGNPLPPNYRSPMMNPTTGGVPPGGLGGMITTQDMQQQMLLRHQQVQQRRIQMARFQQIQMQRRAAAMQQIANPAGAAQGQQYAMQPAPGPMQANSPIPMGQMMQPPQQPQYVQQAPGAGMMSSGPQTPYYNTGQQAQYMIPPGAGMMMSGGSQTPSYNIGQQPQYAVPPGNGVQPQYTPRAGVMMGGAPPLPSYDYGQQSQYTMPPRGGMMMNTGHQPGQLTMPSASTPPQQPMQPNSSIQQPVVSQVTMPAAGAGPQPLGQPPTGYPIPGQPPMYR